MSSISNFSFKPVQLPDSSSIKETLQNVKTFIQIKTEVCAKQALNSLNSIGLEVEGTAKFAASRMGVGTSKETTAILKTYRQSISTTKPSEESKEQKNINHANDLITAVKTNAVMKEMKIFESEKTLIMLAKDLDSEINQLSKKNEKINTQNNAPHGTMSLPVDDREKYDRLKLMKGKLENDPGYFIGKIKQYGKSDLYRHLKSVAFLSILVKSDQNIGILENLNKGSGNPSGLSEEERVALHYYTTNAYVTINEAGRKANLESKEITDPGMRVCFALTTQALNKLPDALAVDNKGVPVELKRSYFPPRMNPDPKINAENQAKFKAFTDKNFVKGQVFNDGSFLSTTIKEAIGGAFTVSFELPEGSTTIPGGKKVGFPYSAFSGVDRPDEGEVLFGPDAHFEVSKVEGNKITFKFLP
jgi:hypothetical protein